MEFKTRLQQLCAYATVGYALPPETQTVPGANFHSINTRLLQLTAPERLAWLCAEAREHGAPPGYPPGILIDDSKYGDIGSTAAAYARAVFETEPRFDAATVNIWGGLDSLHPWTEAPEHGVFVWLHHAGPGAKDFMRKRLRSTTPLYQYIAEALQMEYSSAGNVGIISDAGIAAELHAAAPDLPLLLTDHPRPGKFTMVPPLDKSAMSR